MSEQEFTCYYAKCSKSYKTKYNLRRHINSNHLNIREFVCMHCSKLFACKQNLIGHEKLHLKYDIIPELEIPRTRAYPSRENKEEIKDLLLSNYYYELKPVYNIKCEIPTANLPILPPISLERTITYSTRLPVMHILLK